MYSHLEKGAISRQHQACELGNCIIQRRVHLERRLRAESPFHFANSAPSLSRAQAACGQREVLALVVSKAGDTWP